MLVVVIGTMISRPFMATRVVMVERVEMEMVRVERDQKEMENLTLRAC